jgi:hypothetical protein
MSHSESIPSAFDIGTQTSAAVVSGLIDTSRSASDENLQSANQSEADALPERFQSDSTVKPVVKPGETDNPFVREQPW